MGKEIAAISQLGRATVRQAQRLQVPMQRTLYPTAASRPFSAASYLQSQPQDEKDRFHDRGSLDPQRTEVSESGTNNEVAGRKTSFDPSRTSPESEFRASKEESKSRGETRDPLDVSPANKDVGGARDPTEGTAQNVEKAAPSGRGPTRKHHEVNAPRK